MISKQIVLNGRLWGVCYNNYTDVGLVITRENPTGPLTAFDRRPIVHLQGTLYYQATLLAPIHGVISRSSQCSTPGVTNNLV